MLRDCDWIEKFKIDVLVIAGDITWQSNPGEWRTFFKFVADARGKRPAVEIVMIAGNHDQFLDADLVAGRIAAVGESSTSSADNSVDDIDWKRWAQDGTVDVENEKIPVGELSSRLVQMIKGAGVTYLENESATVHGFKIWGSPLSPEVDDKTVTDGANQGVAAFAKKYETTGLRSAWQRIPDDVDVLITHTPAWGYLDKLGVKDKALEHEWHGGDQSLLCRIHELSDGDASKLRVHICGHVHEGHGEDYDGKVVFVNASISRGKWQEDKHAENPPVVFDIEKTGA